MIDERIVDAKTRFLGMLGPEVKLGEIALDEWPAYIDGLRAEGMLLAADQSLVTRQGITYPIRIDGEFHVFWSPEVFVDYPDQRMLDVFIMVWALRLLAFITVYDAHATQAERERAMNWHLRAQGLPEEIIDFPGVPR